MVVHRDLGMAGREVVADQARLVGAAVVHHDYFEALEGQRAEQGKGFADDVLEVALLVEGREDDAQLTDSHGGQSAWEGETPARAHTGAPRWRPEAFGWPAR